MAKIIRISIRGGLSYGEEFEPVLGPLNLTGQEGRDRLIIQEAIDNGQIPFKVLYDGNSVYGFKDTVKQFKAIFKRGNLEKMSNKAYEFLHLCCGSIAHYNKQGWIWEYDNSADRLRAFFRRNEYGSDIVSDQSEWATDRVRICEELLKM